MGREVESREEEVREEEVREEEVERRQGQERGRQGNVILPFLQRWKDVETSYGTLSSFTPSLTSQGFLLAQVLDITLVDGRPTGEVVIHDMEKWVRVKIEKRYVASLVGREWGKYSIVQIKATTGLHTKLFIVSIFCSLLRTKVVNTLSCRTRCRFLPASSCSHAPTPWSPSPSPPSVTATSAWWSPPVPWSPPSPSPWSPTPPSRRD